MVNSKKRGREKPHSLCTSSSPSSSSSLSLMQDGSAASRWSKEVMGAVEAHLGLLQQHYHRKQHRQHQESSTANYQTMCRNDCESDDCESVLLNGHSNKDSPADDDDDGDDVEQNVIGANQLVDLINCQAAALPEGWEQHLDLRTGEVYYIHWKSCKKSNVDPRKMVQLANERILNLMHYIRNEPSYIDLHSSLQEEEVLETSPSECVTWQSASMSSCTSEEVHSKYTPFCYLT